MKSEIQKTLLPIAAVALLIIIVGTFGMVQRGESTPFDPITERATFGKEKEIMIGDKTLLVEVADTPEKRTKGLSGRSDAPESGHGMLFDFGVTDANSNNPFWMKDMNFAIDVIWINDGVVAQIDENVPAPKPNTADDDLPLYYPDQPVDYVVEVAAGETAVLGINIGDAVTLSEAVNY